MASHAGVWVPCTLVHFDDLNFIVNTKGGLEGIYTPIQPTSTDLIVETLRDL